MAIAASHRRMEEALLLHLHQQAPADHSRARDQRIEQDGAALADNRGLVALVAFAGSATAVVDADIANWMWAAAALVPLGPND